MTDRREDPWTGEVLPQLPRQQRWYDAAAFLWLLVLALLVLAALLGAAVTWHEMPPTYNPAPAKAPVNEGTPFECCERSGDEAATPGFRPGQSSGHRLSLD